MSCEEVLTVKVGGVGREQVEKVLLEFKFYLTVCLPLIIILGAIQVTAMMIVTVRSVTMPIIIGTGAMK